jgi:mono/diheme cytochrome c family protein
MRTATKFMTLLVAALVIGNMAIFESLADHDEHQKRMRHQKRARNYEEHNDKQDLTPVNNATYKEECGACHFTYQPGLLPSGSWNRILSELHDHFGEAIDLNSDSKKVIAEYLKENAADRSSGKLSRKIMKSLGSLTPKRITEVPYIVKEHHEIGSDVFRRKTIGSFSTCSACHKAAEEGIYDDDYVSIPP